MQGSLAATAMLIGFVFVLAAMVVGYGIAVSSALKHARRKAEGAWQALEAALQRRNQLTGELAAALDRDQARVAEVQRLAAEAKSVRLHAEADRAMRAVVTDLARTGEGDAALRAELEAAESALDQASADYNAAVRKLNTVITTFPSNVMAGFMGLLPLSTFPPDAPESR
ncbi:MAG: hypothetical protein EA356_11925 [Geminicoccaceae bacterium]|nr:MAG: hypothetical protein EA356_11925 [Geminicoccaceae bacterium]